MVSVVGMSVVMVTMISNSIADVAKAVVVAVSRKLFDDNLLNLFRRCPFFGGRSLPMSGRRCPYFFFRNFPMSFGRCNFFDNRGFPYFGKFPVFFRCNLFNISCSPYFGKFPVFFRCNLFDNRGFPYLGRCNFFSGRCFPMCGFRSLFLRRWFRHSFRSLFHSFSRFLGMYSFFC